MDKLEDEDRALAWSASWHPSFDGIAILNQDFTFRSANPQFCKLLGVTPADLIGERYQDITPQKLRKLEEANCRLLVDGSISFYLLPKTFLFPFGHKVNVMLLVSRVPATAEHPFRFFVCRIMLDNQEALCSATKTSATSKPSSQKWMGGAVDFVLAYGKILAALGAVIAGFVVYILDYLSR